MTFTSLPRYPGGKDPPPSQRERNARPCWSDQQVEVTVVCLVLLCVGILLVGVMCLFFAPPVFLLA
jgi:hypothetical protein